MARSTAWLFFVNGCQNFRKLKEVGKWQHDFLRLVKFSTHEAIIFLRSWNFLIALVLEIWEFLLIHLSSYVNSFFWKISLYLINITRIITGFANNLTKVRKTKIKVVLNCWDKSSYEKNYWILPNTFVNFMNSVSLSSRFEGHFKF